MPDGAWVRDGDRGLVFRRSRPITGDVVDLVEQISLACEGWLTAQGYAPEEEEEPLLDDDDTLALFQAASLQDLHAVGPRAGRRVRPPAPAGPQRQLPAWCGVFDGYNLHAGVVIPARDRAGLGRLARYMLRPPLVGPRVERQPDGSVVLTLKRPWANGTTSLRFAPAELVARLIALIPPFREHQVRYHGVFAPNASWRKEIVPRPATEAEPDQRLSKAPPRVRISGPSWSNLRAVWRAHEAPRYRHRAPGDDPGAERVEVARAACAVSGRRVGLVTTEVEDGARGRVGVELCLRHAENPNQPALTSLLVWCGRQRRTRVTGGARLGRGLFVLSAPPGPRGSDACAENNHRVPERSWGSAA